jgi:hypothetical protein
VSQDVWAPGKCVIQIGISIHIHKP